MTVMIYELSSPTSERIQEKTDRGKYQTEESGNKTEIGSRGGGMGFFKAVQDASGKKKEQM